MKRILISDLMKAPGNIYHDALMVGRMVDGVAVEVPDDFPIDQAAGGFVQAVENHPLAERLRQAQPLAAPDEVAAERLAVCEACVNGAGGRCRLFACCNKDLAATVKMALQQCPIGRWPRWLPSNLPQL